jgi:DNA polymerase-3 subunit delta
VDELLADIQAGRLDPIYVLHSEHPILIERMVSAIRDVAVPPMARGFNYDVVEGKPSGSRIVSLAQTLPMMAQRRMVRCVFVSCSDSFSHNQKLEIENCKMKISN